MLFRSALLSLAFWLVFLAAIRVGAVPPEDCGQDNNIENAARLAMSWIENNQFADGTYVYEYNSETNTETPEYNAVRHAGVTMSLYQAARHFRGPGAVASPDAVLALKTADKGLGWMLDNTVHRGGLAMLAPSRTQAELGASDLMLVSLAERRLTTGETKYDELMKQMAAFIVSLQRNDGGFYVAYDLVNYGPQLEGTSRYYPGESLLGLAMMHEAFPNDGWDVPARKTLDFITTRRDEVENVDFPPLADQWAAYAIGEMAGWTPGLTDQQAEYAHSLAARFSLLVRSEAQRQGSWYGHLMRGRHARGAGAGTWIEGLTGLWRASQQDDRLADIADPLVENAKCMAGVMAENQVSPDEAKSYADPVKAEGAWFSQGATRMDDQQHTLSGLIFTLDALAARPPTPDTGQ